MNVFDFDKKSVAVL